ncbi:MAG: hypothetical protein OXI57_01905 [Rhodospirillales bacterium]|nr:hypothetical protein [Rhodospirillales bacterium]
MTGTITLYHPVHAPDGQPVYTDGGPLASYADEGWVDDPAKIGVNRRGENHSHEVARRHLEYMSGEIPGIAPGYGKGVGPRCAIWNTVATDRSEPGRDGFTLESPRSGGRYFISGTAAALVQNRDERLKARLTTWLVDQRRLGNRCPEVTSGSIEDASRYRDLTVGQRVDRLLRFIAGQTPGIGTAYSLTNQKTTCAAMAWSESTHMKEVRFLLDYIRKRGWLEEDAAARHGYVLTIDGHARLADLDGRDTGSSRAFVAMWFDPTMDDAWEQGIKRGIEDSGYEPVRIDEAEFNDRIDDEIIAEIRRSRFLVADFTQDGDRARGGVYYEAGFALGLDLPVIFTCRQDVIDGGLLHFDTRQYNHIGWTTPEELRRRLADRIAATFGDGPSEEG